MSKVKKLQRQLIKLSIIFLVILAVFGGIYYYVSDKNDEQAEEIAKLKAESGSSEAKFRTLQAQLNDADSAVENYKDFPNSRNGDKQNFRRDFARTLLASLRDQDNIIDLQFSMEPFTKATGALERPLEVLVKSKITIQLTADTDIDVFNLIRDISNSFPGNVDIISYSVERLHTVDDNLLIAIGEGRQRETLVKGEIVMEWQGIQDNLDYKKSTTPPAGGPPGAAGAQPAPATLAPPVPGGPGATPPGMNPMNKQLNPDSN